MRKINKFITGALITVSAFTLVACGNTKKTSTDATNTNVITRAPSTDKKNTDNSNTTKPTIKLSVEDFLKTYKERYGVIGFPSFDNLPKGAYYVDAPDGAGAIFCPDEGASKYIDYLKEKGFKEIDTPTVEPCYALIDKDLGLEVTVTVTEATNPNGVGLIFNQDIPRYTMEDIGENFSIRFACNYHNYIMIHSNKDYYVEEISSRHRFYLKGFDGINSERVYEVYESNFAWVGWYQYDSIKASELPDFFNEIIGFDYPFYIMKFNPGVTYKYEETDEKYLDYDRPIKKYVSLPVDGKQNKYEFITDAETNICLEVREIGDGYSQSLYNVDEEDEYGLVVGVTPYEPIPDLDSAIIFPIDEIKDRTGYDFPEFIPEIDTTWMYSYRNNETDSNKLDVTVYGLSGEEYAAYQAALIADGFKEENNSGVFTYTKKDLTNMKVYKCVLNFRNGSSIRNKYTISVHSLNELQMSFWTEDYVKSTWPNFEKKTSLYSWYYENNNDWNAIPEFESETAEFGELSSRKNSSYSNGIYSEYAGYYTFKITDYTQAELSAWIEKLLAADGGTKISNTIYSLDGSEHRFLVEFTENSAKTELTVNVYYGFGRLTFPRAIIYDLFPDLPTLPEFNFPEGATFDISIDDEEKNSWTITISLLNAYQTTDNFAANKSELSRVFDSMSEFVTTENEQWYYAPLNEGEPLEGGVLYTIDKYILTGSSFTICRTTYTNDFFHKEIPSNSPLFDFISTDFLCDHIYNATYDYETSEGGCKLTSKSYGWTKEEAEELINSISRDRVAGTRAENGTFTDTYTAREYVRTETDSLGDNYDVYHECITTVKYLGYEGSYELRMTYTQEVKIKVEE